MRREATMLKDSHKLGSARTADLAFTGSRPSVAGNGGVDLMRARQTVTRTFPSLALLADRSATLFGVDLSRQFRGTFEVTAAASSVSKAGAFSDSLESPGCHNALHLEALGGAGLLAVELSLLYTLLERLFGGGTLPAPSIWESRVRPQFSAIEERVVRRLVRIFGRSMEAAWRPILPVTVRHVGIETKPGNVPICNPSESVMSLTFAVSIDGMKAGQIHFAMPLSLLDAHKKRLSATVLDEPASGDDQWRDGLAALLSRVAVELVAELGHTQLTVGQLLALQVGDVIRLDQPPSEPVRLTIGGTPKLYGQPTVANGNLALRLPSVGAGMSRRVLVPRLEEER